MTAVLTKCAKAIRPLLVNGVRSAALFMNYCLGNYRPVIWLIGDGRSGTTWVSDILNHAGLYRSMFEPFHPAIVKSMERLKPYEYIRPGDPKDDFKKLAKTVFDGRLLHPRVDAENSRPFYRGLLIKDIYANLFAKWAQEHFPEIKIVLLMRNPFAVALSKWNSRSYHWIEDPICFLEQVDLMADFLGPKEDLIRKISRQEDFILSQLLIWAIINAVPLCQFTPEELHVVFYEDFVNHPVDGCYQFNCYLAGTTDVPVPRVPEELVRRPSRVSGTNGNVAKGMSPTDAWYNALSRDQIDAGLEVLSHFGLAELYGDRTLPEQGAARQALLRCKHILQKS